jgi:hypothetical protein
MTEIVKSETGDVSVEPFYLVRTNLPGFQGTAHLYTNGTRHIVISRAFTFDRGDETMVFEANESGEVIDWMDLYAGYDVSHEVALVEYNESL